MRASQIISPHFGAAGKTCRARSLKTSTHCSIARAELVGLYLYELLAWRLQHNFWFVSALPGHHSCSSSGSHGAMSASTSFSHWPSSPSFTGELRSTFTDRLPSITGSITTALQESGSGLNHRRARSPPIRNSRKGGAWGSVADLLDSTSRNESAVSL